MDATAAVLDGPADSDDFAGTRPVEVGPVEVAAPQGEEVLVEIEAASLCHTDIAIALGELEERYPMVMGHEGAGVVRAVGDAVERVAPGDPVVLGRIACGRCGPCRRGQGNLCEKRSAARLAGSLRTGAIRFGDSASGDPIHHCHGVSSFTSHTVVTEEVAIPITDEVPLDRATLLGCAVFTGVGAVTNTADIELGSDVVVIGAGGVGLSAIQGARIRGAREIVAVDLIAEKLETAEAVGATAVVDASKTDPVDRVGELLDDGADYAFDAVGLPQTTEQSIDVLATRGTAVVIGTSGAGKRSLDIDFLDLVLGEKRVQGSFNGSYTLQEAIPRLADLVAAGQLDLEPMISATRSIHEINEAMHDLEHGTSRRQIILPE